MKRTALILTAVASLALPATASADRHAPALSLARGQLAIAQHEPRATVTVCRKDSRITVVCRYEETITAGAWAGWEWASHDIATLHHNGRISVAPAEESEG